MLFSPLISREQAAEARTNTYISDINASAVQTDNISNGVAFKDNN